MSTCVSEWLREPDEVSEWRREKSGFDLIYSLEIVSKNRTFIRIERVTQSLEAGPTQAWQQFRTSAS